MTGAVQKTDQLRKIRSELIAQCEARKAATMQSGYNIDTIGMARSATERTARRAISDALLAEMLGLNEPWIERWEENGALREESCAPDQLPEFLKNKMKKGEVEDLEHRVD